MRSKQRADSQLKTESRRVFELAVIVVEKNDDVLQESCEPQERTPPARDRNSSCGAGY